MIYTLQKNYNLSFQETEKADIFNYVWTLIKNRKKKSNS